MGEVLNTNARYLSRRLSEIGIDCYYQYTVGDNALRLQRVLRDALSSSDLVIVTGGLGPTADDLTKETVADTLGLRLSLHRESLERIENIYRRLNRVMPENNVKQAMLPEGCVPLPNERGTAPGVAVVKDGKSVVILPGPPGEMTTMFEKYAVPFIHDQTSAVLKPLVSRVLRFCGIGESDLETRIRDIVERQTDPKIAPYYKSWEVHIRISTRAVSRDEGMKSIGPVEKSIRKILEQYLYGCDDETLEEVIGRRLKAAGLRLAVAESCTGGWLAKRLTDISGSSDYFLMSAVTYSDESKTQAVRVPKDIITAHGAVSEQTALAMAAGIRAMAGADIGIGITGIAGPGGGSDTRPVGSVWIAISGPWGERAKFFSLWGDRDDIRGRATQEALVSLWRYLLQQTSQ